MGKRIDNWITKHLAGVLMLTIVTMLTAFGYGIKCFADWASSADNGIDTTKIVHVTEVARPQSGKVVYTLFYVEGEQTVYECWGDACLFLKSGDSARVTYYPTNSYTEVHIIQYLR